MRGGPRSETAAGGEPPGPRGSPHRGGGGGESGGGRSGGRGSSEDGRPAERPGGAAGPRVPPVAPQRAVGCCRACGMLQGVRGAHPAQPLPRLAASLPGLGCVRERRIIVRVQVLRCKALFGEWGEPRGCTVLPSVSDPRQRYSNPAAASELRGWHLGAPDELLTVG